MPSPSARPSHPAVPLALALLASSLALDVSALRAQAPAIDAAAPVRTDPFCWRGRPLPRCRAFALFELGLYGGLATTRLREPQAIPFGPGVRDEEAFSSQLSWSVGAMRNRDSTTAVGGALVVAFGDAGNTVVGTARWRRWAGRRTSVELAAGPGASQVPLPLRPRTVDGTVHVDGQGIGWRPALLGEARANAGDLAALSVRGVVVPRADGRTHAALFAGASVGSGLAVAGTVGLGAFVALAIAALSGAFT